MGVIPSIVVITLVVLVAARVTRQRYSPIERHRERLRLALSLALATTIQAVHFLEETIFEFHVMFPAIFGLPAMPFLLFLGLNFGCLILWLYAIFAIDHSNNFAFGAAWFLALAGMLNLLAHPLISLVSQSYFPGLYTSPLVGLASIWLISALMAASRTRK